MALTQEGTGKLIPLTVVPKGRLLPADSSHAALLGLIVLGVLLELFCIVAIVQPLSLGDHSYSIAVSDPLSVILGNNIEGVRGFVLSLAAAVLLYGSALLLSLKCRGQRALGVILGFSVLFCLTLLLAYPAGSGDVFTNIINGRMRWLDGLNPMVSAPLAAQRDPLFAAVTWWQQEPSYYGPFWYLLLFLPTKVAGDRLLANLLAFRALMLPFVVGCAWLAARLAAVRRPRLAPAAALFVGWSPLFLWESVVNGHNDAVMVFFAIFALERALNRTWSAALPLLALSILTKYVTVILLPLLLLTVLIQEKRGALRSLVLGSGLACGLATLSLAPFWAGHATFAAVISKGANRFISSPATLIATLLDGKQAVAYFTSPQAGVEVKAATLALFLVAYAVILARLWRGSDDLLTAAFYSLFFYLMLLSWWFWPWYVSWLVVIGGALVGRRPALVALVFSLSALCGYIILAWRNLLLSFETNLALPAAMVLVVFLPAFACWVAGLPRPFMARRMSEKEELVTIESRSSNGG
ncbi:MAG: hypothetical protein ACR2PL_22260 [Dehalococcoidia bacterium]